MQRIDGRLAVSASDLVGFLGCEHLTVLDQAVAEGRRDKPKYRADPQLEIVLAYCKNGEWTVIDFKTAHLVDASHAVKQYGPQLAVYRKALSKLATAPVRSALCVLRTGRLVNPDAPAAELVASEPDLRGCLDDVEEMPASTIGITISDDKGTSRRQG